MRCESIFFFVFIVLLAGLLLAGEPNPEENSRIMRITAVCDNRSFDERLMTEWGFSCLIQTEEIIILFDTGGYGEILLHSMKELSISPAEIDAVFLALDDWGHTGGLYDLLGQNKMVTVYVLKSWAQEIRNRASNSAATIVEMTSPAYFYERVATTGDLDTVIAEQSLVLETEKG